MPLQVTATPSSRVTKSRAKSILQRRSSSSPFSGQPKRKLGQRSKTKPEEYEDEDLTDNPRLDSTGPVTSLTNEFTPRDVVPMMNYVHENMFDEIPERAGMTSTRIAEILNFRKTLPPLITNVHLHALTKSTTTTEREIASLMAKGVIKKIVVPGRGVGASSISEGLALAGEWISLIQESVLNPYVIGKYIGYIQERPLSPIIPATLFSTAEATLLMHAGFLVSSSQNVKSINAFSHPDRVNLRTMTSIDSISKSASGTMAAVGGVGAVQSAGGSGSGGLQGSSHLTNPSQAEASRRLLKEGEELQLSLPNTGPFLRLLTSARTHFLSLLSRSKYSEAPLYLLRERWDGAIDTDSPAAKNAKGKGAFSEVLPGRTRKWKMLYGLKFEWVVAECLGAGLIEVFNTRSVGLGVRAL